MCECSVLVGCIFHNVLAVFSRLVVLLRSHPSAHAASCRKGCGLKPVLVPCILSIEKVSLFERKESAYVLETLSEVVRIYTVSIGGKKWKSPKT